MSSYVVKNHKTYKVDEDQQEIPLANFTAQIVRETRTIQGLNTSTELTIHGQQPAPTRNQESPEAKPIELPEVVIDASEFASFAWVLREWGSRAVIFPGGSVKDDLRTAIQLGSTPEIRTVYGTLGWMQDERGHRMYLHAKGAVTKRGQNNAITVVLPPELSRYDLTSGQQGCTVEEAFQTSLRFIELGPKSVMWPLWAATFIPIFGPTDFAVHLTGRSGTFKSEITSLIQSHYGASMDARHLPASWSSTANALEAQAYFAANSVMIVDDFVPVGTSYAVKAYQTSADRLIRGAGNQAGRARLSDTASFKSAYYPRGLILSTGEDTPEGHSVRARMMILELSPGDIDVKVLTELQSKRTQLPILMAEILKEACTSFAPVLDKHGQNLDIEYQARIHEARDVMIEIGHSRTPPMLGRVIATIEWILTWAMNQQLLTEKRANALIEEATNAIVQIGEKQMQYLESADPVQILLNAMRQSLMNGKSHIRSMSGGVPTAPETLGWTATNTQGEMTKWKAGGNTIGWVDRSEDMLYFEADLAYAAAKQVCGQDLTVTKGTAWKRLKDCGLLARTDATRQRNTIRVQADGHTRNVLAIRVSDFFDTQEVTTDGDEHRDEDS